MKLEMTHVLKDISVHYVKLAIYINHIGVITIHIPANTVVLVAHKFPTIF